MRTFRGRRHARVTVRIPKESLPPEVQVPGPIIAIDWEPPAAGPELEITFEYPIVLGDHSALEYMLRREFDIQQITLLAIRVTQP